MLCSTVFSTEEVVTSDFGRLKPGHRITTWNHICLGPKGGNVVRMDHILAGHCQLDATSHRKVERVDLSNSIRMLRAPHPLFPGHEDLKRVFRLLVHIVVDLGAPGEDEHRDQKRNDCPCNLERHRPFKRLWHFIFPTTTVPDHEKDREHADDNREEEGQPHQKEEVQVHFIRKGRRTLWQERNEKQRC